MGSRLRFKPPLTLHSGKCPNCGASMFVKAACCGWKKNWITIARCMNAACRHTVGITRKPGGKDHED